MSITVVMSMTVMGVALLSTASSDGAEPFCLYPEQASGELTKSLSCGTIHQGLLTANSDLLGKVAWSQYGINCIYVSDPQESGWFYINQLGLGRRAPFNNDNDCAWFESGVTVGLVAEQVVFFNPLMDIVHATDYRWASNFHQGYAKVCKGALTKIMDSHGEHYRYQGGQCGFIDRDFSVVIPVQYPYQSTPIPVTLSAD